MHGEIRWMCLTMFFFSLQIGVPKHTFSHILVFVFFIFILAKIGDKS